ncbi:MAG TPA: VanW family protein [Polyangiaceae bacterium]
MKRIATFGGALAFFGLLAGAGAFLRLAGESSVAEVPPNVRIDGVPAGEVPEATIHERAAARLAEHVRFEIDGKTVDEGSVADFGAKVDEVATAAIARGQKGDADVPLVVSVDVDPLMKRVLAIKEDVDLPPVSARVDFDNGGTKAEQVGRYVDVDAVRAQLAKVAAMPTSGEAKVIQLETKAFAPRLKGDVVKDIDVGVTLSSFDTGFSRHGEQARRGKNIDVGASKLDGLVLMPNELVSFNDVVGARSEENGFSKSWEIFKGEMVEGIGGGTCQVASTLHAAAFFAGLDIVERLPHSRPSAYIQMGLDATVVYPVVDMKLKNPYPFPVVVHAFTDGNRLHFEVRGKQRLARVTFSRELKEVLPFDRKIEEKQGVSRTQVIIKQHGMAGFKIERKRIVRMNGREKEEKENDTYPATNEVLVVAPGFDVTQLPALPDQSNTDPAALAQAASTTTTPPAPPPPTDPNAPPVVAAFTILDSRGSHPPTASQLAPEPLVTITR